jgi:class 3 adenylate cyclase
MDRVLPHGKSGRADYLGPPANRAARLMAAAQGGQVRAALLQATLQEHSWHWGITGGGKAPTAAPPTCPTGAV